MLAQILIQLAALVALIASGWLFDQILAGPRRQLDRPPIQLYARIRRMYTRFANRSKET